MPRPQPSRPLGVAVWARRTVLVAVFLAFVVCALTLGPPTGPDPVQDSAFRLMIATAAVAAAAPSLVWLKVDPKRVVLDEDALYAPTVLGWRRVPLRPLGARVTVVATDDEDQRRWRLAHGIQPIVLFDPLVATSALPGGDRWPGRTLDDVLTECSGADPSDRGHLTAAGVMLVKFVAFFAWLTAFTVVVGGGIVALAGIR